MDRAGIYACHSVVTQLQHSRARHAATLRRLEITDSGVFQPDGDRAERYALGTFPALERLRLRSLGLSRHVCDLGSDAAPLCPVLRELELHFCTLWPEFSRPG